MMYLSPGNLPKSFIVERKQALPDARGRVKAQYEADGSISAVLAAATPKEQEQWRQMQHPISHTIVQKGTPKVVPEDRFIFGSRYFYVQGVDDPGSLGLWTIYYVEERNHGDKH